MFRAGTAIADVSPKTPMFLCGYPEPADRYNTAVHDPLYVSAFYFDNGKEELLLFTADLCFFDKRRVAALRSRVEKACGIPFDHVLLSATHTHSAPVTGTKPFSSETEEMYPDYNDFIEESMLGIAVEAKKTAFPASLGVEKGTCGKEQGIGGNRHDPNAPADTDAYIVCIKDADDVIRGILTHYSLHPTLLHAESRFASADFPGYMRVYFAEKYPKAVFGFFQGTSGNQSSRFFRTGQTFEEAERFGRTIAAAADQAVAAMKFTDKVSLAAKIVPVYPPLKTIPPLEAAAEKVARSKAELAQLEKDNAPYPVRRSAECTLIGANLMHLNALDMQRPGGKERFASLLPMEMQLIALGEARLVCLATEMFVEFGLEIKAKSPAEKTFVVALANGTSAGYVYTKKAFEEGGYEASGSLFTDMAGEVIVNTALEALRSMK